MSKDKPGAAVPNGGTSMPLPQASTASSTDMTAIERLRDLEALFLGGPLMSANQAKCFSTETLLDVLMVLYNECCNSSLRKEKTVSEFIELGTSYFGLDHVPTFSSMLRDFLRLEAISIECDRASRLHY